MNDFINPVWLRKYLYSYNSIDEIPDALYASINEKIDRLSSAAPLVSIVIAARNEEVNLLSTLNSLAESNTDIPIEFIVVNNNSTDRTQEFLNKLHVKSYLQVMQGWGPARQLGLEQAKGKYILTADADCIYPVGWVDGMVNALKTNGVVCVYGRYSFIGNAIHPRWKLLIYEKMKNVIAEVRHLRRPFLNAMGMNMGFIKELALKGGYIMENVRGEDGILTLSLMQFGKIAAVKDYNYQIWTGTRTIEKNQSLFKAIFLRVIGGLKTIPTYLTKPVPYTDETADAYKLSLINNKRTF